MKFAILKDFEATLVSGTINLCFDIIYFISKNSLFEVHSSWAFEHVMFYVVIETGWDAHNQGTLHSTTVIVPVDMQIVSLIQHNRQNDSLF